MYTYSYVQQSALAPELANSIAGLWIINQHLKFSSMYISRHIASAGGSEIRLLL